jgi:hypothetical protein
MPTPDMRNKETIYYILVQTSDKRLVTDLQRFLGGSSQHIDLRVPGAFISVKTELESYKARRANPKQSNSRNNRTSIVHENDEKEVEYEEAYSVEILLRRQLPDARTGQTQSPYG